MFLMIWSYFELYQDSVGPADVLQFGAQFPTEADLVVDDETVLTEAGLVCPPHLEVQHPQQD